MLPLGLSAPMRPGVSAQLTATSSSQRIPVPPLPDGRLPEAVYIAQIDDTVLARPGDATVTANSQSLPIMRSDPVVLSVAGSSHIAFRRAAAVNCDVSVTPLDNGPGLERSLRASMSIGPSTTVGLIGSIIHTAIPLLSSGQRARWVRLALSDPAVSAVWAPTMGSPNPPGIEMHRLAPGAPIVVDVAGYSHIAHQASSGRLSITPLENQ